MKLGIRLAGMDARDAMIKTKDFSNASDVWYFGSGPRKNPRA
jgi:hypothetical protein